MNAPTSDTQPLHENYLMKLLSHGRLKCQTQDGQSLFRVGRYCTREIPTNLGNGDPACLSIRDDYSVISVMLQLPAPLRRIWSGTRIWRKGSLADMMSRRS